MRRFIAAIIVTCGLHAANAQSSVHFDFQNWNPLGVFGEHLSGKQIGGLSVGYTHCVKKMPKLEWGTSLGVGMYAYRQYWVWFVPPGKTNSEAAEVYEDDCIVKYNGQARYQIVSGTVVTPYALATIGVNRFFSHIDPVDKTLGYQSQFRWQGAAVALGAGFGARVDMMRLLGVKKPKRSLYFDIHKTVNYGTRSTYRYFKSDEAPHEDLSYGRHKSATSYSAWEIGFGYMWKITP